MRCGRSPAAGFVRGGGLPAAPPPTAAGLLQAGPIRLRVPAARRRPEVGADLPVRGEPPRRPLCSAAASRPPSCAGRASGGGRRGPPRSSEPRSPLAAPSFRPQIRWEKNITLGEPPGFLHSWWW